ncbi:MAG: 50S ribosomal protein L11 methyltransferase [Chitinophagaceae bacterium]|nr:50S ribosomal protein L11 methyltransferase [Chitinophagaceae bacterium]
MNSASVKRKFDIILANINKNVILENMNALAEGLTPGGILLLSGLLEADEADVSAKAKEMGFKYVEKNNRNGWIILKINK